MKTTGIIRKVDELGRVVLPVELRRTLDIQERDALEIHMDGEQIILKKHECSCVFCKSENNVVTFKGKTVCKKCIRSLSRQISP